MRSAFSMIMAISVIVIMATVAMFVTNLSSKSVKATTAQYQRAQAMLYAKSYTEFAILAVTAHDRAADCVETIKGSIGNINQGGYAIHTHIAYIGPATITLPDGTIENNIVACPANLQLSTNVTTTSTH